MSLTTLRRLTYLHFDTGAVPHADLKWGNFDLCLHSTVSLTVPVFDSHMGTGAAQANVLGHWVNAHALAQLSHFSSAVLWQPERS